MRSTGSLDTDHRLLFAALQWHLVINEGVLSAAHTSLPADPSRLSRLEQVSPGCHQVGTLRGTSMDHEVRVRSAERNGVLRGGVPVGDDRVIDSDGADRQGNRVGVVVTDGEDDAVQFLATVSVGGLRVHPGVGGGVPAQLDLLACGLLRGPASVPSEPNATVGSAAGR